MYGFTLSLTLALYGDKWSTPPHVPAALPPGMTRYTPYTRLGGLQDRSGRVW
jgi:hypothetical protein